MAGITKLFDSTLAAPAASIDTGAGGISTAFDALEVWVIARTDEVAALSTLNITANNDATAIYDFTLARNRNTTVTGATAVAQNQWQGVVHGATGSVSYASVLYLTIPGYAQTTFWKSATLVQGTPDQTAANTPDVSVLALGYRATTAISRMKIAAASGNLVTGSRLLIYGL